MKSQDTIKPLQETLMKVVLQEPGKEPIIVDLSKGFTQGKVNEPSSNNR
jgi:hypothetical protein